MSYQVIARKWRPQKFASLIGQNHISQTLLNALKNQRIPQALLFTGPRGTGKTSTARIFAKSLRCPKAIDFVPCGECSDCLEVAQGQNLNVIEIDGASNNGVDAIRELRDTVGFMPSSGKYKVYIIDEVHMLSTSAFNALLKTLEEPPPHVIFVMATTEVHKIPSTILSRCQRYDFRRISLRLISEHLQSICKADNINAEPEALWMLARQGDGSMRDSQSLLDQVISFSNGDITLQKVTEVLGLTDRHLLLKTVDCLVERNQTEMLNLIQELNKAGYDAKIFVQELLEELRHLLIVKLTQGKTTAIDLPDSEVERLIQLSAKLSFEDIHLLFDMALKGANDLMRAQDTQVVLEMILLRMSLAPRVTNLVDFLKTPGAFNSAPSVTTAAPPTRAPSVPLQNLVKTPAQASVNTASIAVPAASDVPASMGTWSELTSRLKKVNGLMGAKLENTYLVESNDKRLVIGVPQKMKFIYDQVNDSQFKVKLSNYINTFWGKKCEIEVRLDSTTGIIENLTPKEIVDNKIKEDQDAVRKQVENHPLVRSANEVFKTEIKSIKEIQ